MLIISYFSYLAVFNHRYSATLSVPYLKNEYANVFKTVVMNNVVDVATSVVPDVFPTLIIFYPLAVVFYLGPQLLFRGGYFIASSIYYLGTDLDEYFVSKNFKLADVETKDVETKAPKCKVKPSKDLEPEYYCSSKNCISKISKTRLTYTDLDKSTPTLSPIDSPIYMYNSFPEVILDIVQEKKSDE
jgi:hypothetical protein